MKRIPILLLPLLGACAAASAPSSAPGAEDGAFRVTVLGDMPYVGVEDPLRGVVLDAYAAVLDTVAAEEAAFVVHVGDLTGAVCSDSLFLQRQREFAAIPRPVVYTPGDNEWTDCARDGYEPLERLARLRELFAAGDSSLGGRRMPLERQPGYPENARWRHGGVLFATLHVVGSNNNRGAEATPRDEFTERSEANLAWMREAFAAAEREGLRGVALFMQANPFGGLESRPAEAPPSGYRELMAELHRLSRRPGRPVLLVHGDSHTFRVDKPLVDELGRSLLHFTRAETFGSPDLHALRIVVDPRDPNLFRAEPLLVPANGGR